MNTTSADKDRRSFAQVIGAIAAIVAECNHAQTRVDSLRNTPAHF